MLIAPTIFFGEAELGGFIYDIIPGNFVGTLAIGQLLPTLLAAILFGIATATLEEKTRPVITFFEQISEIFFKIRKRIHRE